VVRTALTVLLLLIVWPTTGLAQVYQCPPGSTQVSGGGGIMCQCPDGSYANINGCSGSSQEQPQQQQSVCPAGTEYCPRVNLCCGSGNYCSIYGCIQRGSIDCGGYSCNPGMACMSGGRCMPAGNTECGNRSCSPGYYCGSRNSCLQDGSADCGNGSSCSAGNKCSRNGQHCLSQDTVDCGSFFCNAGMKCGSGNKCLALTAVDCGGGKSCSAGTLCIRGGAECLTRQEIADRAAAEKQRRNEEAARLKREADERREAARKKEEERKQEIARKKEEAERARVEKQRQIEETRQAAKRKQEEEAAQKKAEAEAKRLAEEQRKAELRRGVGSTRPTGVRQVIAAWNPARIRRAQPIPLPEVAPEKFRLVPPVPRGEPRSRDVGSSKDAPAARGSNKPYTVPLKWAGKLFSKSPEGDSHCSAQFIAPRIILTAAHCVRAQETGKFFDSIVFALQYENGRYSQIYAGECVATPEAWVSDPEPLFWRWDYALLLTDREAATGYFGWQSGWEGTYDTAHRIGYPIGAGGEVIQVERGALTVGAFVELRHGNPNNPKGASGGAMVGHYDTTFSSDSNYAISVNSHTRGGVNGIQYGPYFGAEFKRLFDYVYGGCQ
jgi:hypothetical protein